MYAGMVLCSPTSHPPLFSILDLFLSFLLFSPFPRRRQRQGPPSLPPTPFPHTTYILMRGSKTVLADEAKESDAADAAGRQPVSARSMRV